MGFPLIPKKKRKKKMAEGYKAGLSPYLPNTDHVFLYMLSFIKLLNFFNLRITSFFRKWHWELRVELVLQWFVLFLGRMKFENLVFAPSKYFRFFVLCNPRYWESQTRIGSSECFNIFYMFPQMAGHRINEKRKLSNSRKRNKFQVDFVNFLPTQSHHSAFGFCT